MRIQPVLLTLAAMAAGALLAQAPNAERELPQGKLERIAALKQSIAANQAALKQYAWTETTQIKLRGEVRKTEQKSARYGLDGKIVRTPVGGQSQQQPPEAGRIGERLREEVEAEVKDYAERVTALLHQYAPPDVQKIEAARAAGNLEVDPSLGITKITVKNYLKPGDSVQLGFEPATKKISSYDVNTYLDNPSAGLMLAVNFAQLPDGTNHPERAVLASQSRPIEVVVTNSDYHKIGQ